MSACDCAHCGQAFSCVTAFDAHIRIGDGSFASVECRDPASAGLRRNRYGLWAFPPDARSRERAANFRALRQGVRVDA